MVANFEGCLACGRADSRSVRLLLHIIFSSAVLGVFFDSSALSSLSFFFFSFSLSSFSFPSSTPTHVSSPLLSSPLLLSPLLVRAQMYSSPGPLLQCLFIIGQKGLIVQRRTYGGQWRSVLSRRRSLRERGRDGGWGGRGARRPGKEGWRGRGLNSRLRRL